jgi:hypothetical protein
MMGVSHGMCHSVFHDNLRYYLSVTTWCQKTLQINSKNNTSLCNKGIVHQE